HLYLLIDTATTEIYTLSLHDALPILDMGFGHEKKDGVDSSLESFSLLRICRYLRWNFAVRPCRHAWASFNCNLSEFFECKQSRKVSCQSCIPSRRKILQPLGFSIVASWPFSLDCLAGFASST